MANIEFMDFPYYRRGFLQIPSAYVWCDMKNEARSIRNLVVIRDGDKVQDLRCAVLTIYSYCTYFAI